MTGAFVEEEEEQLESDQNGANSEVQAKTTVENYTPKCGRHRKDGFAVNVRQSAIPSQSQFGEWPGMCAMFKLNIQENIDEFIGGASLLAPGAVLTAAHLVK